MLLAPDESSKKSGKDLASPAKWVSKGGTATALWGECQGSGSTPYRTQVDLTDNAFKCSCPSRKFPCKHGLGLLLYHARRKEDFTDTEMPPWVKDWIDKRGQKQEKAVDQSEKPVDTAAQAKRLEAREKKVAGGTEDLLLWLKDLIRGGILAVQDRDPSFIENMARRMVDAQAPGLAGMIRELGEISTFVQGWESRYLDQLLRIYLVASGYKNSALLEEGLAGEVRNRIGFPRSQDELKEQPGLLDTWLVLGKQTTEEDNLTVEKYWLYGTGSSRYALVLQFIFRGQGGALTLTPGMFIEAELAFYPGAYPLRAIVKRHVVIPPVAPSTNPVPPGEVFSSWDELLSADADFSSRVPFHSERPYILREATPFLHEGGWWIRDSRSEVMPLDGGFKHLWTLLALSGGKAVRLALVGKEKTFEPLGVWEKERYTPLL